MRTKYCFAPNCKNNSEALPNLSFHSFPSNERIVTEWAKNMNMEEKVLNVPKSTHKHYYLCGEHFKDSCFQTYEKKKLNRGAVPTIFNITEKEQPKPKPKFNYSAKQVSSNPVVLNHQIVFPNIFTNTDDVKSIYLQHSDMEIFEDSSYTTRSIEEPVLSNTITLFEEKNLPDMELEVEDLRTERLIPSKSNVVLISPVEEKSHLPTTVPVSSKSYSPIATQISVESALSKLFGVSNDGTKKSIIKYKDRNQKVNIKIPKKNVRRLLIKAKKIILILQKSQGNCMNLFNKHITIFNSKTIQYLEKLDNMPPAIKTYMNNKIKYLNKAKSKKYKKDDIQFYVALYKCNQMAYKYLLKIFNLPTCAKLNRFLNKINLETGINSLLFEELRKMSLVCDPLDRYCTLLFREIRLCPSLSYNKCGDIIEGLQIIGQERTCNIVNQCFVFMLRGIHQTWKQSIAYYFVPKITMSLQYCIKEVINELHEKTKFQVVASVSSMNATNIFAIRSLMANESNEFVYRVNDHEIIHIFDPPDLLRTLRNNFIDYNIVYDQTRIARWSDIVKLVEGDEIKLDGLTDNKVTKLTAAHLNPNKIQRKQTLFAAQIFSSSIYRYLTIISRLKVIDTCDTADFCLFIDKLFDSMNGSMLPKYINSTFSESLNDSSPHLEFWTQAEKKLSSLRFINNQTGKQICNSYVEDAFLLNIKNMRKLWIKLKTAGFNCLETKSFNLDPLDNFLEIVRCFYTTKSNPTSLQFQDAFKISLFNQKLKYSKSEEDTFLCVLKPQIFSVHPVSKSLLSNTQLLTNRIYLLVQNVRFYSAENITQFLSKQVLRRKCVKCVDSFTNYSIVRLSATEKLILQIRFLQREVYKKIPEYLNQQQFIEILYSFAEQYWSFDFVCSQHKYEMKYRTIMGICFIMVKCFIEITNKMLSKQPKK